MITHDDLLNWETSTDWWIVEGEQIATLARIVRLAIAADEFTMQSNAKLAALRDALREEGLR